MVTKTFKRLLTNLKKKPTRYLIFLTIFLVIVCIYTTSLHIEKLDWLKDLFGKGEEEPSTPTDVVVVDSGNSISSCLTSLKHFNPLTGLCETPTTDAQCVHFAAKIINPSPTPTTPCRMASQLVCKDTGRIFDSINVDCKTPINVLECNNIGFANFSNIDGENICYDMDQVWCSNLTPKKYYNSLVPNCELPTDNEQCEIAHNQLLWTYGANPTGVTECIPPFTMAYCRSLNKYLDSSNNSCLEPFDDYGCLETYGNNGLIPSTWDGVEDECHWAPYIAPKPIIKQIDVTDPAPSTKWIIAQTDFSLVHEPTLLLKLRWDLPIDDTTFIKYELIITYPAPLRYGGGGSWAPYNTTIEGNYNSGAGTHKVETRAIFALNSGGNYYHGSRFESQLDIDTQKHYWEYELVTNKPNQPVTFPFDRPDPVPVQGSFWVHNRNLQIVLIRHYLLEGSSNFIVSDPMNVEINTISIPEEAA